MNDNWLSDGLIRAGRRDGNQSIETRNGNVMVIRPPSLPLLVALTIGTLQADGAEPIADVAEAVERRLEGRVGVAVVDGHRLSDPQTGQVDLALLPVVMLEEIEIIHGAASGLYGSESMAGAVNLRTVPPAKEETYSAIADMGAFGQRRAALKLNGGAGPLSASFATELSRSDGDFSLPERYGASSSRRREADYRRFSAFGSMVYRAQRHRFNLSGWTADAERGLPGPATTPPVGERQWDHLKFQYR